MTSRLTLTLPPDFANKTVEVDLKRFSIGRTPDNDLEIDDGSLSRRHALIEDFEGRFTLTDCGSSNGTFVNGREVGAPVELSDWDVLTFGGVGDVLVRIEPGPAASSQSGNESEIAASDGNQPDLHSVATSSNLVKPIIAIVAVAVILSISGIALLVSKGPEKSTIKIGPRTANDQPSDTISSANSQPSATLETDSSPIPSNSSGNEDSSDTGAIEAYAARVLSSISRDTKPVLTEKPLSAISSRVQTYRNSSSLEENLRTMKRALPQVSALAKANNIRTPLAVYATLARIDENGGRGDPAQVAASVCSTLGRMRDVFGDELANDSLLALAGMKEGAALQGRITRLAGRVNDSPTTIRSIWYLHNHQVINDQTYDFVLRFMAIGVIAQDPTRFGVRVEPISF